MPFQPQVGEELAIDGSLYRTAEHPAAPGVPYGQEGRQATVYRLVARSGESKALKVFKPRFRAPARLPCPRGWAGMPACPASRSVPGPSSPPSGMLRCCAPTPT